MSDSQREPIDAGRRRLLAAAALVPAVGSAGCVGFLAPEFAATPVVLPPAARSRLGYREVADESIPLRASVGVASATLRSHLTAYGPAGVDGTGGTDRTDGTDDESNATSGAAADSTTARDPVLVALATPDAEVAGRALNPLVDVPVSELVTGAAIRRLVDAAGVLAGDARGVVDPDGDDGFDAPDLPTWETPPEPVTLPTPVAGRVVGVAAPVESFVGLAGVDDGPTGVVTLHLLRVRADDVVVVAGLQAVPTRSDDRSDGVGDGADRPLVGEGGYVTLAAVADGAARTGRLAAELVRRADGE